MTVWDTPATARISGPSSSLAGLRVVVTGLGVSGFPAAIHLAERGAAVIVVDADTVSDKADQIRLLEVFDADVRRGAEHVASLPSFPDGAAADLVVTSPGWRPDQPLLAEAAGAGIPVWGEVELAWRIRGEDAAPWLVVTGTNGKTTVTSMLATILDSAGLRTRACGNIGAPLLEAVLDEDLQVLAVELSSFQLHWQTSMAAHAAAVLNISSDHLDWHGSLADYIADKAKAYHNAVAACVFSLEDPTTLRMVEEAEVTAGARAIGVTLGVPRVGELGVVDDLLVDRAFLTQRYDSAAELGTLDDVAAASGLAGGQAPPHQVLNALAAAALARSVGVPPVAVRDGLRAFAPGEHRIETVAERAGVRWVDDSKATNPHAAEAALASFEDVVWIAGGLAKGADYSDLVARYAGRLRAAVLIGADRSPLLAALAEGAPDLPVVEIEHIAEDDLPAAERGRAVMARAVAAADDLAQPGSTVLLAPAAASMDQFKDYALRGEAFSAAVKSLEG